MGLIPKPKLNVPGDHMFEGGHAWTVLDIVIRADKPFVRIACPCGEVRLIPAKEGGF